ncbi:Glutaredoxin 3 [Seminavis robusta]|uniref:Glutaredoxin 3 n=1 Tax=Seminavis robusta TaxID=568900 RepID=A0A9N8HE24_9STRA|nr:Glutaredoxin 3 [Seminavis robusta]|eukprot:Sro368_g128050.1 Glutaredoxin 3 (714) ;mRNA; f:57510-59820
MGRITIFSTNDCHFCLRAKRELQYRCLPFVEIDIGAFPERKEDMLELAGRYSVPQIFLNDTWIGGCDKLLVLLDQWDNEASEAENDVSCQDVIEAEKKAFGGRSISEGILENCRIWRKYQEEVASKPDPADPRLALPTPLVVKSDNPQQGEGGVDVPARALLMEKNVSEADLDEEGYGEESNFGCIPLPDGTCAGIREVTNDLVENMPRHKLAYLAKFYTDCFPGKEGVDALLKIYPFESPSSSSDISDEDREEATAKARAKAVKFGLLLQQYGILHHVCNERKFQDTSSYYYRLQPFHEPRVLNSFQSLQRVLQQLPKDHPVPKSFRGLPVEEDQKDLGSMGSQHDKKKKGMLDLSSSNHDKKKKGMLDLSSSNHDRKKKDSGPDFPLPLVLTPQGALALLSRLQKLLTNIEVRATGRDGIDFLAAKDYDDPDFQLLEEGSCQLQCMDPMALAATMTHEEKMVFGIHLYNIMVRHAYIKVGIPLKSSQRGAFFTGVCYNVANQILSLDDVEHGIIRANTRHPYHLSAQFVGDDPRRAWAVSKLDPRIHFTLFCGANSCPPSSHYTVDNLENELQLAAESFVQEDSNVLVDRENNTLHLSMLFKWYRSDFGASSNRDLPAVILKYLPKRGEKYKALSKMFEKKSGSFSGLFRSSGGADIKIKFLPYDWGSKAAPGKCLEFTSGALRTREVSLRAPFSKQRGTSPLPKGCIPAS